MILASCALPFGTCTTYLNDAGEPVTIEPGAELPPGVTASVVVQRPIEHFDLVDIETYPSMIAFLWPLAFAGAFARWPGARNLRSLRAVQLLLIFGSFVFFYVHAHLFKQPAWGYYVATSALALYALAWAVDARSHWPRPRAAPA